jgi:Endoribonuclease L-PSP
MDDIVRISSSAPWEPIFGYSRAVRAGDWVAVSGSTGLDENGQLVGCGQIYVQARQAISNIASAAGPRAGARRAHAGLRDRTRSLRRRCTCASGDVRRGAAGLDRGPGHPTGASRHADRNRSRRVRGSRRHHGGPAYGGGPRRTRIEGPRAAQGCERTGGASAAQVGAPALARLSLAHVNKTDFPRLDKRRAYNSGLACRKLSPISQASTARAHSRPSQIAHTTSDCPRRVSPAANTPGTLDM